MSTTTTQILFNSPALHSLKRDQLVKLCKIHALKASGKNKDLIERLKLHAKTLPPDDPLSIATRSDNVDATPATDSEDEGSNYSGDGSASVSNNNITRPSEQWEVVMDTIAEVDEETLRSNRGASDRQVGEFGTTASKASSVTSSLRAIANSLGLKRNTSKSDSITSSSSLSSKEAQSSSTLPTSDPNGGLDEPRVEPIPGQSNLQGLPAPSGARLSLSQAPATTTIRLVSNLPTNPDLLLSPPKLEPFATSFDLVPGTPSGTESSKAPVWPFSPGGAARESIYPTVPTFQGFGDLLKQQSLQPAQYDASDMDIDVDIPGGLAVNICEPTPEKTSTSTRFNTGATPKSNEKPSAKPVDIFSPGPKLQSASTRSRLGIPRSEPFVFGSPLPQNNTSNLQFRTAAQSVLDEMNKRLAEEGVEAVTANVLSNRRTTIEESTTKPDGNDPVPVGDMFSRIHQKEFDKMDSITSHYAARRGAPSTASQPILSKKRKSSLVVKERASGVPAARHRPNGSRVASGASMKTLPGGFGEEDEVEVDEIADRRLSKRPRVEQEGSEAPPVQPDGTSSASRLDAEGEAQKQKEREAIRRRLEHNKAKRRSSMGRPSIGRATPAKPARFGLLATAKSLVQNVWNRGAGLKAASVPKSAQAKEDKKAPTKLTEGKKSAVVFGPSGAPSFGSRPTGGSNTLVKPTANRSSTLAIPGEGGGARSPASSSTAATIAGYGQSSGRGSSLVGFSSLGTKSRASASDDRVSGASAANLQKQVAHVPRSRTMSTLMAPTASSLAKTIPHSRIPVHVASQNENATLGRVSTGKQRLAASPQPSVTLEQITNSPRGPAHSPRPVKIFSQPLSSPVVGPSMSLTGTATSIVGQAKSSPCKPPIPPKPKVLPGRRPRISRSKVIARLASQRAAGTSTGASVGSEKVSGKVRSSMGVEAAGKARQSYGGAKGGDVLMSAKKRVRQSEQARRRSRAMGGDVGRRMDVD